MKPDVLEKRILLTNAGSTVAQNIITYNLDKILEIHGVDAESFCYASKILGKNFYLVPSFSNWLSYKKALLKICKEKRIDLIIPCSSNEELIYFSRDVRDFEEIGTKILVSNYKAVKLCDDKFLCNKFVAKLGIKVLPIFLLQNMPQKIIFPLLMKNRKGEGSGNLTIINNKKDLSYFKFKKDIVFQKLISGQEYSIDMVLDNYSKMVVGSVRKRLATKAGICTKTEIVTDQKLLNLACPIAENLKLIGGVNVQFIDDYFIDVNPRLPGGLGLITRAGFNMALLSIKSFFNLPIKEEEKRFKKIKVLRIWQEVLYE